MSDPVVAPVKLPIKDFKEAMVALCAVSVFGVEAVQQKKFDFNKAILVFPKIQLALDGYQNILPQAMDVDSEEGAEVVAAVAAELVLSNEKAKAVILASVKMIGPVSELVHALRK